VNRAVVVGAVLGGTRTARDGARSPVKVAAPLAPPARPKIRIAKGPNSQTVEKGAAAKFRITVTNAGNVQLRNVTVSDPRASRCNRNLGALAAGKSKTYRCSRPDVTASFLNRAFVTGTTTAGRRVADSDTAMVTTKKPTPGFTG